MPDRPLDDGVVDGAVAMAMGMEFSKYLIAPCGSFTKIARSEDGRVLYSLHTDESFSLFPRRSFNLALKAFLHCLGKMICLEEAGVELAGDVEGIGPRREARC